MIRINLLSDREAVRKETTRQQVSIFVLIICLLLVLLGGVHFTRHQAKSGLEQDVRDLQAAVKEMDVKIGEVEKFEVQKEELEAKLEVIGSLDTGKLTIVRLLDELGLTMPERMWLEYLNLQGTKLSLKGYAIDNETIARFMKDLEAQRSFQKVELLFTEQKEVEKVGMKYFSLVVTMAPPKAEGTSAEAGKAKS